MGLDAGPGYLVKIADELTIVGPPGIPADRLETLRNVLPGWSIRLLVLCLLLPALLAASASFFRARRRTKSRESTYGHQISRRDQ